MRGDPQMQAVIREIVRRLVERLAPERIILFGSYAYGEPDADSDIDLLIIQETSERFIKRIVAASRAAAGVHWGIPFEPNLLTPQEVEQRLRIDPFVAEIIENGEVLYAA